MWASAWCMQEGMFVLSHRPLPRVNKGWKGVEGRGGEGRRLGGPFEFPLLM